MKKHLYFPFIALGIFLLFHPASAGQGHSTSLFFMNQRASALSVRSDEIAVTGEVYYWSLEDLTGFDPCQAGDDFRNLPQGKYLPLKNTYIESEYELLGDDPDAYTHEDGYYYLKKSGLDAGSYDVDVEVRAKTIVNSRWTLIGTKDTVVTVFKSSLDAYAVNAQTADFTVHTGELSTHDIYIGGPDNNLLGNDSEGLEALASFWLAQDLAKFYVEAIHMAPNPADLPWDSYVLYPQSKSVYRTVSLPTKGHIELDASNRLFPSTIVSQMGYCSTNMIGANWKSLQATLRHEYSHQVMDMAYPQMPADDTGDHAPNMCSNGETAITEGFAEFLPAAILNWQTIEGKRDSENLEFGYNPYMTEAPNRRIINEPFDPRFPPEKGLGGINWHYMVTQSCTQPENSEGEVAAVFWDIFDPLGWEYLPEGLQPAGNSASSSLPSEWKRPLRWYDWLADPYLEDFWRVFTDNPMNLVGDHTANNNSFWSLWLNRYRNDLSRIHGLKAVLYNRGIDPAPKPENAPVIESISLDATLSIISVTISEPDAEDRRFLYFNVGYMKRPGEPDYSYYYNEDRLVRELGTDWKDGRLTISIPIPRGKLGRVNTVLVHDSMLTAYKSVTFSLSENHFDLSCASKQPLSFASAVEIQGNIAYVADMESGLFLYDISEPFKPVRVGQLLSDMGSGDTPWGGAMDVEVEGDYAYIAAYSGALVVVDVRNPNVPVLKGYLALTADPRGLAINGKKAYLIKGTGGLVVVDIQHPATPVESQNFPTAPAYAVAVRENRVFVAGEGGIQIFSLGIFPRAFGEISIPGDAATGVALDDAGLIFTPTRNGTLQVFDISTWQPVIASLMAFLNQPVDPEIAFPVKLDELATGPLPGRILITGRDLYGAGGIFDISEPEMVYQITPLQGDDFAMKGDAIYAVAGTEGLLVYSRTALPDGGDGCGAQDQQNGYLEPAGVWEGHINDMAFANGHAFMAAGEAGLAVLSVEDPNKIHQVAAYGESDPKYPLNAMGVDVDVSGSSLYLPSMAGDLQVLDISRPAFPRQLGLVAWNRYEDVGAWQEITNQYGFVFLCAGEGGMRVLDVRTPTSLSWKGKSTLALTDCTDVAVSLPYVYGLGFSSGLHIFEMTGPSLHTTPEFDEISNWSLPQSLSGTNYSTLLIDEENKRLYVSSLWNGVSILDISDPSRPPIQLSSIDPGRAYGLALDKNTLFVGDDDVIHIIDVSDIYHPRLLVDQELTDRHGIEIAAIILRVYKGYLYVATSQNTLQVYHIVK